MLGQDVADASRSACLNEVKGKGGVFKVTSNLQRQFGDARVFNTPLAEANIIGRSVGMALRGLKPIADPVPNFMIPFGKARMVRPGQDVTLITYGALVQKSWLAAQQLAQEQIDVEVIDLRSLNPYDWTAIAASVRKPAARWSFMKT